MNIAYLIVAHEAPSQLGRLTGALSSEWAGFFVHIDRKSNIAHFRSVACRSAHFIPHRIPVYWGDFSFIEATLMLMREALEDPRHFERFVLLSGADYPLRSADFIEQFFQTHRETEFLELVRIPSRWKPISRLNRYKPGWEYGRIGKYAQEIFVRTGLLPRERDYRQYLHELIPYGGAAWWALSREACKFVMTFVEQNRRVVDFFRHTHIPDESFFHTVLGNSDFASRLAPALMYTDWSAQGWHPAYINEVHLETFKRAMEEMQVNFEEPRQMLFARKFTDASGPLIRRIDAEIRGCPNG